MKSLILSTLIVALTSAQGADYRYNLMATTGLQEQVMDSEEKTTTIVFSDKSYAEAKYVLSALLELEGISGTLKASKWNGFVYDQHIVVSGTLGKEVLRTLKVKNGATSEEYKKFRMTGMKVNFPLIRGLAGKAFDTAYLEVHFSFETLFPNGLKYNGKPIDLGKYRA